MAQEGRAASSGGVSAAYDALVARGVLTGDPAQRDVAGRLDGVAEKLESRGRNRSWFGLGRQREKARGLYIHGDVGRGKTLLMDLFFETVTCDAKQRVHFHQFMDEIHSAIAAFRNSAKGEEGRLDPVEAVTRPIIAQTRLLCLDEFHVHDITNAMLLKRLFDRLFAGGVVVVATSNVAPRDLYRDGLNRQLFLPFVDDLEAHADVVSLDAQKDYRRDKFGAAPVFVFDADEKVRRAGMDAVWDELTGAAKGGRAAVRSLGRDLVVPRQALGVARFSFAQLCEAPLGARDYLRLIHAYDTFIVDDVPHLDRARTDAAKRFILFIDTAYDRGAKLAASFEAPLDELLSDARRGFEFQRTRSRLVEMQSHGYLQAPMRDLRVTEETAS